jgi:thiamine biosynthesis protein ThiS
MNIIVNGTSHRLPDGLTITALLENFQLDPATLVVERNLTIIPREQFDSLPLSDGDEIELIRFVGGG